MGKQVTSYQLACIFFIATVSNKLLILPALMYVAGGNDAIIFVLIQMIYVMFLCYLTILFLKKLPNLTFEEIVKNTIGKFGYKLLLIVFLLYYILKIILTLTEGQEFLHDTIYTTFTTIMFIVPLVTISVYIVSKGLRCVARTTETTTIVCIIGLLATIFLSIQNIKLDGILPIFTANFTDYFEMARNSAVWFGNIFIIFYLLGKVKVTKEMPRQMYKYAIIGCLFVLSFFFIFYSTFGECSEIHKFAIVDITSFAPALSAIFKLDWLIVIVYSFVLILEFLLQLFIIINLLKDIFNWEYSIVGYFSIIVILCGAYLIIPFTSEQIVDFCALHFGYVSVTLNILLPLFMVIGYFVNRKKQKGNDFYESKFKKLQ